MLRRSRTPVTRSFLPSRSMVQHRVRKWAGRLPLTAAIPGGFTGEQRPARPAAARRGRDGSDWKTVTPAATKTISVGSPGGKPGRYLLEYLTPEGKLRNTRATRRAIGAQRILAGRRNTPRPADELRRPPGRAGGARVQRAGVQARHHHRRGRDGQDADRPRG